MANAAPPEMPPARTQAAARPEGNGGWVVRTREAIINRPPQLTRVVKRKTLARREAYPPRKSLVPQARTAARLKAAGATWFCASTKHEGSTQRGRGERTDTTDAVSWG